MISVNWPVIMISVNWPEAREDPGSTPPHADGSSNYCHCSLRPFRTEQQVFQNDHVSDLLDPCDLLLLPSKPKPPYI